MASRSSGSGAVCAGRRRMSRKHWFVATRNSHVENWASPRNRPIDAKPKGTRPERRAGPPTSRHVRLIPSLGPLLEMSDVYEPYC